MKHLKCALDLDGVIADFASAWRKVVLEVCAQESISADRILDNPTNYNLGSMLLMNPDDAEKIVKKAWDRIENTTNFWLGLEPYPKSSFSSSVPFDVFYITARKPTAGLSVALQTEHWIYEKSWGSGHLFRMGSVIPVPRADDKVELIQLLDIDYLLDDRFETIRLLNKRARGKGFLIDRPWNQKPADIAHDEPRVKTVQEFIDLVTI